LFSRSSSNSAVVDVDGGGSDTGAGSSRHDLDAFVDKACALIQEAATAGADLVDFPEGFIPAHPAWFTDRPTAMIPSGISPAPRASRRQVRQASVVDYGD